MQIIWKGRLEPERRTIRQPKPKPAGMEKLAVESGFRQPRPAIKLVSDDRMANKRQMDANLVRAPGLDRNFEQCGARKSLDDTETRHRWPP
jgi:hypothetical protein